MTIMTDPGKLVPLLETSYELMPLKGIEKRPLHNNWTNRPYQNSEQLAHMKSGANVGVRLRLEDLVIDVDPRNFPKGETLKTENPLQRLCTATGLNTEEYLTVRTGGGGLHMYMTKPNDVYILGSLKEYPGIEFKTFGQQTVAPGSVHPDTFQNYEWQENEALDDIWLGSVSAPTTLLELIKRPSRLANSGGGEHSQEELGQMLSALDPEDFHQQDDWLTLMQACHHATAGDGRMEFIEWSTSDPEYADHGQIIGRRWDSLCADNETGNRVTVRTLYKLLRDNGSEDIIPRSSPENDFSEDISEQDLRLTAKQAAKKGKVLESSAPMALAKALLSGKSYLRCNGDWLQYSPGANRYETIDEEQFTAWVWTWADGRSYRSPDGEVKKIIAKNDLVSNVTAASKSQCQGPSDLPKWHPAKTGDPDPRDLLSVRNGLLHLPSMEVLPPNTHFVCRNASPVQYSNCAPNPDRWLRFLDEVFPEDPEVIATLQEVIGYLLTQDTSQHKIFCLVGPPRSGKGTINRIVQRLVGEGNYTSPALKDLATDFGLERLIGKQLATISDMRMGRRSDPSALAENLLRISGEDEVSVNRKYKEPWEGLLRSRFLMLSNETPQFRDTSGAIVSRMILMKATQSFLGREDANLTSDLTAELPGILNWSLEGLVRHRLRGRFVQPASSTDELVAMDALASPVKAFAEQHLSDKDINAETSKDDIWDAFYFWIDEEGYRYGGDKGHFFKDLKTVGLRFVNSRPTVGGKRVNSVKGLTLQKDELD